MLCYFYRSKAITAAEPVSLPSTLTNDRILGDRLDHENRVTLLMKDALRPGSNAAPKNFMPSIPLFPNVHDTMSRKENASSP